MIMTTPSEIYAAQNTVWSEDFERLPLKHRLKLLLASNRLPLDSYKILKNGDLGEFNCEKNPGDKCVNSVVENPLEVKIGCGENYVESCLGGCMDIGIQENSETKMSVELLDKLDHVALKDRLRMLFTREYLEVPSPVLKASHNLSGESRNGQTPDKPSITNVKVEPLNLYDFQASCNVSGDSGIKKTPDKPSFTNVKVEPLNLYEFQSSDVTYEGQTQSWSSVLEQTDFQASVNAHEEDLDHMLLSERMKLLPSRDGPSLHTGQSSKFTCKMGHFAPSCSPVQSRPAPLQKIRRSRKILKSGDSRIEQTPEIPSCTHVKVEPPNLDEFQSNVTSVGQISSRKFVLVKTEVHEDYLDHMLLSERVKLLSPRVGSSLNTGQSSIFTREMGHSASSCRPVKSKSAPSIKINRPRKRQKTATDSVETAMEEDAPGLLQVLVEKGVSVDEIKLYGEPESNDALDDSSTNDGFGELEEVMTKLFSERESLLKYAPVRCSKGEKAIYCLECLFSLVEQARYLQFRHWPVEWGWCRDLQSFIFVFERHNRIVLERPEYGYATYFFELTNSVPIHWQVKRLVIAMKLCSCSRITLIENKALMVGDDLSEGEARVLMEYGWIPNTGLGTMLNYYDRVVHDRRNEKDGSEWRLKIGKLLMDGYNGGTIIPTAIPIKVMECNASSTMEIKLELS